MGSLSHTMRLKERLLHYCQTGNRSSALDIEALLVEFTSFAPSRPRRENIDARLVSSRQTRAEYLLFFRLHNSFGTSALLRQSG
jgi:hypothetical protein